MTDETLSGVVGALISRILAKAGIKSVYYTTLYKCHGNVLKGYKNTCFDTFLGQELAEQRSNKTIVCGAKTCKFFGMTGKLSDNIGKKIQLDNHGDGIVCFSLQQIANSPKLQKRFFRILTE